MRNTLLFIALFGPILLTANESYAQCSCGVEYLNMTARDEFNRADAVFVGKIVTIKNTPPDKNNRYVQTINFQVTRAWKQDVNFNLTLTNKIDGCKNGFEENEEWLVYAYKNQDGTLGAYCCCTRTKPLANADDDVKTFVDDPPAKILRPKL